MNRENRKMDTEFSEIKLTPKYPGIPDHLVAKWRTTVSKLFGALLLLMIFFSGSHWHIQQTLLGTGLFLSGLILCGIGTLGRLWCSTYIAGYKDDRLIIQGPYALCRNPLYFFSAVGALGVTLATETFSIPLLTLIVFGLYYPSVIKDEESLLEEKYSTAYQHYKTTTPRFIPRFSLFTEPAEYLIRPSVLRRHFRDVIWFIWLFGIISSIVKLHGYGYLPSLISMY